MWGNGTSFSSLLLCWWAAMLLLPALGWLWRADLQRPRSLLPLAAVALALYQHAALAQFGLQCRAALLASPPAAFLVRSFDVPLS
jgi:hypothetical protein